jgi:SWI/SNF-related matrix-associated actin-dependent regulator of chromatin subfamily D
MLKVYISHHAENQAGFGMVTDVDSPPCWTLRVEARLELFGRQGRTQVKPFSHFLKSMVVQLGDGTGPGQLIEWIKNSNTQETDGFEIKRTGTTNTPVRVVLRMDHQPEQFRVSPELAQIIDPESKTKPKIILDIWHYIKEHKLQESDEKKIVQNDETLRRIFGCDKMSFAEIPAKLSPHLLPPLPIELEYFISVDRVEGSAIWEVEVELDDPAKPRQMAPALVAHQRELALLEQKIGEVGSALKASAIHERNLNNFATSPVETMRRLMEAHIEDHEIAMGEPHITTEDLMRAGSFDNEELERAISVFSSAHVRPHPFRL